MLQPLGKNLLLRGLKKANESGIILPSDNETPDRYHVLAAGYSCIAVDEGDIIMLVNPYPQRIVIDNEELYISTEENVLGVVKE